MSFQRAVKIGVVIVLLLYFLPGIVQVVSPEAHAVLLVVLKPFYFVTGFLGEVFGPALKALLKFVFIPGFWAVNILHSIGGSDKNPFEQGGGEAFIALGLVAVFSWLFWSFTLSRVLMFFGLWNPFWGSKWFVRPMIIPGLIRLKEGREIKTKFGKKATGSWAGIWEILSCRYLAGDVFWGRARGFIRPIGTPTQKHMMTIGAIGSGKSTAALIPNLCVHEGSLLCIDPKGELARISAHRRGKGGKGVRGMGQEVVVVDPFGIVQNHTSAQYNPFDELARVAAVNPDNAVSYAGKLADALVTEVSQKDPFFDKTARDFIQGLILYIFITHEPEKRTLGRMRELAAAGDVDSYNRLIENGEIGPKDQISAFDVLYLQMMDCRDDGPLGGIVGQTGSAMDGLGDNTRGSVNGAVNQHTSFLDAPQLRRVSERSDFLLEDLKNKKMSVYLCMPFSMVAGKEGAWLRMFILLFVDMMERNAKPPKLPVLLAIDEFPNLGRMKEIERVIYTLRSYGVRLWVLGQDFQQFETTYPDSWRGFFGGAEAVQLIGLTEPHTIKEIVSWLGRHAVVDLRAGRVEERSIVDEEQLARLLDPRRGCQVVWRGGGRKPMWLRLTPYYEYLPFWYYDPDPNFEEKWNRRIWRQLFSWRS